MRVLLLGSKSGTFAPPPFFYWLVELNLSVLSYKVGNLFFFKEAYFFWYILWTISVARLTYLCNIHDLLFYDSCISALLINLSICPSMIFCALKETYECCHPCFVLRWIMRARVDVIVNSIVGTQLQGMK